MFEIFLFFLLVTVSHALFLNLAKSNKIKNKLNFWKKHYFINGILWLILLIWIIAIQFSARTITFPFWIKLSGFTLCLIGFLLVIAAFRKISLKEAMGYRFFSKTKVNRVSLGVYKFLTNPMYDGFVLIFLGLGFLTGIKVDFYLAAESFLLLNLFLAIIESLSSHLTWRII